MAVAVALGVPRAADAAPYTPQAASVELGVALSWPETPTGVRVQRRVEGVGDWSAVSEVIRRNRWVDDTVRPDIDYEYRLEDPTTGERSGVVQGTAQDVADTGAAVTRVSRLQSATLLSPCLYDYELCGGEDPRTGRDSLVSAGGPPVIARDRGAVVTSPAGTFRLGDLATRACDGGGVTGGATLTSSLVTDNSRYREFDLPMTADADGMLEQDGDDLRARFGGPLSLIYRASMSTLGDGYAPDVWFSVHPPGGGTIDSMYVLSDYNHDDETLTEDDFGWSLTVSFSWTLEFGWVPAGSKIVAHARVSQGAPDSSGKPQPARVNALSVQAARPAACAPAISPDGHRALVSGAGSIEEVDVDDGTRRTVCSACGSGARQPEHPVYDVDGRTVLLAENGTIYRVRPNGSSEVAFTLPDGEKATDPVVLADGSVAVVGERGVWTVAPDGQRRLMVPGAGLVGVDGAGRLLAARRAETRVPTMERGVPDAPGAEFFDVERGRTVLTGGGTQLFAGPGARGNRTRVTTHDISTDLIPKDQGVSSSGAANGLLPTVSGPRGLHSLTGDTTVYPVLSSESPLRPEAPVVGAPAATNAPAVPVTVTGQARRGVTAARFVISGQGAEQPVACGSACAGTLVREQGTVDAAALPEGTYRIAGAIRETGGGASYATTATKLDRTPPASEQPPLIVVAGDEQELISWPGLKDPVLSDGTEGSGGLKLSARRLDASGKPIGDWQDPTDDVGKLKTGPGGAEVRGFDAAGNATVARKAEKSEPKPFDPKFCKRDKRDPARPWLGISVANPSNDYTEGTAEYESFERVWDCFDRLVKNGNPWIRHQVPLDALRDPRQKPRLDDFLSMLAEKNTRGVLSLRGHGYPKYCDGQKHGDTTAPLISETDKLGDKEQLQACQLPKSKLYKKLLRELKSYVDKQAPGRVTRWAAWNEPDLKPFQVGWRKVGKRAEFVASTGVVRAAAYFKDAIDVLPDAQVLAGEFAAMNSPAEMASLTSTYKSKLGRTARNWALHPYKDVVDPGAKGSGFTARLIQSAKPSELFLTEAGALLSVALTPDGKKALPRRLAGQPKLQRLAGVAFRKVGWGKDAVAPFKGLPGSTKVTMFYYQTAGVDPSHVKNDPFDSAIADYDGVARAVLCGIALQSDHGACTGRSKSSADYQ